MDSVWRIPFGSLEPPNYVCILTVTPARTSGEYVAGILQSPHRGCVAIQRYYLACEMSALWLIQEMTYGANGDISDPDTAFLKIGAPLVTPVLYLVTAQIIAGKRNPPQS